MRTLDDLPPRFWDRIEKRPSGCLIWLGGRNGKKTYGRFTLFGRVWQVHRLTFAIANQIMLPAGIGWQVDHGPQCESTLCANAEHMQLLSFADHVNKDCRGQTRYCPQGHDKDALGRTPRGRCLQCKLDTKVRGVAI